MCNSYWKKKRGGRARKETADTAVKWKRKDKKKDKFEKDTKSIIDRCTELINKMNDIIVKSANNSEISETMPKATAKTPEMLLGCKICQANGAAKWCKGKGSHTRHLNQAHPTATREDREPVILENRDTIKGILGIQPSIWEEEDDDFEASFVSGVNNGSATSSTQNPQASMSLLAEGAPAASPTPSPSTSAPAPAPIPTPALKAAAQPGSEKSKRKLEVLMEDQDDTMFPGDSLWDDITISQSSTKKAKEANHDLEVINNAIKNSKEKLGDVTLFFNQVREHLSEEDGSQFQSTVESFSVGMNSMYEDLEAKYKEVVKNRDDKQAVLEATLGDLALVRSSLRLAEHARDKYKEELEEKIKEIRDLNEAMNIERKDGSGNTVKIDVALYVKRLKNELVKLKTESDAHKRFGEHQKRLADGVQLSLNHLQQSKDELQAELKALKKRFPCDKQKVGECLLDAKSCEYLHRPPKETQVCHWEKHKGHCKKEDCEFMHKKKNKENPSNVTNQGTANPTASDTRMVDTTNPQNPQVLQQVNSFQGQGSTTQGGQFVAGGGLQPFMAQGGTGPAQTIPPGSNQGGSQMQNQDQANPSKNQQKKQLKKEIQARKNQKQNHGRDQQKGAQGQGSTNQGGQFVAGGGIMNPMNPMMIVQPQMQYQAPMMPMMNQMMQPVQYQQPVMMQNQMQQAQLLQAQLNSIQATMNGGQQMNMRQ